MSNSKIKFILNTSGNVDIFLKVSFSAINAIKFLIKLVWYRLAYIAVV